jgi:hypothetical protein
MSVRITESARTGPDAWTGPLLVEGDLAEFFGVRVLAAFADLAIPDDAGAAEYLGDLLTRFARPGTAPAGASRPRLDTPVDLLLEIARISEPGTAAFDPFRAVDLRRDLGDLTLFGAGFLWTRAGAVHAPALARLGRGAYAAVARARYALGSPSARLFDALADGFPRYALALRYLREVYLRVRPAPWPDPTFAQLLRWS